MNILDMVLQAQNGGATAQLARQFGLSEGQADKALRELVPALSGGIKRNLAQPQGLEDLEAALQRQDHSRYYDDAASLEREETVADGNAILGHVFGSKEVSREVASRASANSGVDSNLLKKMLPVVAALVMGSLNRGASGAGTDTSSGGMGDLLNSFLDADKDGSVVDDLLGMAGKFFR